MKFSIRLTGSELIVIVGLIIAGLLIADIRTRRTGTPPPPAPFPVVVESEEGSSLREAQIAQQAIEAAQAQAEAARLQAEAARARAEQERQQDVEQLHQAREAVEAAQAQCNAVQAQAELSRTLAELENQQATKRWLELNSTYIEWKPPTVEVKQIPYVTQIPNITHVELVMPRNEIRLTLPASSRELLELVPQEHCVTASSPGELPPGTEKR